MITINNKHIVDVSKFPNNEAKYCIDYSAFLDKIYHIRYDFDPDYVNDEMFLLFCILSDRHLAANCNVYMPYLPYSRMDRHIGGQIEMFKTVIRFICSKAMLHVDEAHNTNFFNQDGDMDLINFYSNCKLVDEIGDNNLAQGAVVIFPDESAFKRYNIYDQFDNAFYFKKSRHPITGKLTTKGIFDGEGDEYSLERALDGYNKVLIVDDLCEYGGTFVNVANQIHKVYPKMGIILAVWHFSINGFNDRLFNAVDEVYCSQSMLRPRDRTKLNLLLNKYKNKTNFFDEDNS